MKIVYCINRIRHIGGMQRMISAKANALAKIPGNKVYIVVTDHKKGVDAFYLSPDVSVIDLDINYYSNYGKNAISDILIYKKKKAKHRKALFSFLNEINPDIVISTGGYEKAFIAERRSHSWKTLIEYHYERNFKANNKKSNFLHKLQGLYERKVTEKRFDRIVVLTEGDKRNNWQEYQNVVVIPNPVSFECKYPSDLQTHCVVSVGRLVSTKNFQGLIRAFKLVLEKYPDWVLKIYGDGPEKMSLQSMIDQEGLTSSVMLCGNTGDVKDVLKKSSIFAISSLTEGFGLVLVEAMECGVPVISYDCPCGPREIIADCDDGFLVPLNDERLMAERICNLVADEKIRRKMGAAARKKAAHYHMDIIIMQWMGLFNEMIRS